MIQLTITAQGKGYSPKSQWMGINEEKKSFSNMQDAKWFLKMTYGKCKRSKMYVETRGGESIHCGYIYSFRNSDLSHYPVEKWIQRDWVSFNSIQTMKLS